MADDEALVTRSLELRAVSEEKRSVSFIASTAAEDSYGEVVEQDWKLARYKANPVVLFSHDSRELPIGRATRVEVVKGQLEADIEFLNADANPKAELVWNCIRAGALRAVSVGFIPGDVRLEKRNGKETYVLSKNHLHEISVVAIPANPEALAKMRSRAHRGTTARHEETNMNEEDKLRAQLDTKTAEVTAARTETTELRAKLVTVEGEKAALATERDAATARAKAAELALVGAELDALIGTKITPAERPTLLELAGLNADLYARTLSGIKARATMTILQSPVGTTPEQPAPTTGGGGDNGASLAALVQSSL